MGQDKTAHFDTSDAERERSSLGPFFVLAGLLVAVAGILGGASRENPLRLAMVELSALPVGVLAIRRIMQDRAAIAPLALLTLIFAVPLLQLLPLPPWLWSRLPGQAARVEALALANLTRPWLPLSLAPSETASMLLALLPPAAMFLATPLLATEQARRLAWLWIGLAVAGLVLGIAQIAAPAGSPAYPYRATNNGSLVGLFANRNHEAGFLLALLPFAAALMAPPPRRREAGARPGPPSPSVLRLWLVGLFLVMSVVALGVIHSRAGIILAAPALLAALAVLWRGAGRRRGRRPVAIVAGVVILAVAVVAVFGLSPILARFGPQTAGELRFEAWPSVAAAAVSFQPLGSGLGSFDRVFQAVEPLNLVAVTYFNHAHNDFLELWLETGWAGAAVLCVFTLWFVRAACQAWRRGSGLAQAASAAILLMMAESLVDYPLRTEALMVLFAFSCGLLAAPAVSADGTHRS